MENDEVALLRQAAEEQILFLRNLVDALVTNKAIDAFVVQALVWGVEDRTKHPALKKRWTAAKESLQ